MTDIEMSINDSKNDDKEEICHSYDNDNAMETTDIDPLALEDDGKMDVDETNPKTNNEPAEKSQIPINGINVEDTNINTSNDTKNDETSKNSSDTNIIKNNSQDLDKNSIENSEKDFEKNTSNSNSVVSSSEKDNSVPSDKKDVPVVEKVSESSHNQEKLLQSDNSDIKSVFESTLNTIESKYVCQNEELLLANVDDECVTEKQASSKLQNVVADEVKTEDDSKTAALANGDVLKCDVVVNKDSSANDESHKENYQKTPSNIPIVADSEPVVKIKEENPEYDSTLTIDEIKIEDTVVNEIKSEEVTPSSQLNTTSKMSTQNNKVNDNYKPTLLPSQEYPLKSLRNAINRHIINAVCNTEDSSVPKDLEKELPASIVTVNDESNLRLEEGKSSGESDSDEQTLHIVEENVPPIETINPSEASGSKTNNSSNDNKPKRKTVEPEPKRPDENPSKKLRRELEEAYEHHDTMLSEYIANTNNSTIEEIDRHTESLASEIETLKDLALTKETEWNNILRLKKVKEEILVRLVRKKKIMLLERVNHDINECRKSLSNKTYMGTSHPPPLQEKLDDVTTVRALKTPINAVQPKGMTISSSTVTMPLSAPPYCPISMPNYPLPLDKSIHYYGNKKIVPKPSNLHPNRLAYDRNGQLESFMMPMGRQGPTKDVQSIIADYRNRHPESTPRRGRRLRSIVNPQTPQIAVGPRPIAPQPQDHSVDLGLFLSRMENNPHISVSESMTSQQNPILQQIPTSIPNGMSFKDVLVQFASMSGNTPGQNNGISTNLPPPPPYPEVTLHPVGNNTLTGVKVTPIQQAQMLSSQQNQQVLGSGQQNSSLLHGILTKQQSKQQDNRFSSFSPTLARLLTAPEKSSPSSTATTSGYTPQKNCMEITITPVPQTSQSKNDSAKTDAEVVHLDDYDDPELEEDSAERPLVIDEEGADKESGTVELSENEVPECQGCHKKEAQFVCAGCANQWYCSRECQVNAWDEHSEMCSG